MYFVSFFPLSGKNETDGKNKNFTTQQHQHRHTNMHRCLTSSARRCHSLMATSSSSSRTSRIIAPLVTSTNNNSNHLITFNTNNNDNSNLSNNNTLRSMAWDRAKKPKSKQARDKLAADFRTFITLRHFEESFEHFSTDKIAAFSLHFFLLLFKTVGI